jgi:hypothetical protein
VRAAGWVLPRIQVEEGRTMQEFLSQRRARSVATVGGALLLLVALILAAMPSSAATTGFVPDSGCQMTLITGKTFNTCVGPVMRISGTTPTNANVNEIAGLIEFNLEGKTTFMYCVDLPTVLRTGSGEPMTETPWTGSTVPNLPNIKRILDQHPAATTIALAATDPAGAAREAAAVQAAIYHFSDGFDLTSARPLNSTTDDTAAVKAKYDTIVADASAHGTPEPTPSLTITPASATAQAGHDAGPFTVTTSATAPLSLTVSGGTAEIRDCATHAVKTSAASGDQICLFSSSATGPVTLTVNGQAPVDDGRLFINKAHDSQVIILAGTKTVPVTASAQATWTAAPPPATHPAITITKVASPTQVQGPANVTFTYVIKNTGDVPLTIVDLKDDHGTPSSLADDLPITSFKGCDLTTPLAVNASISCNLSYELPAVQVVTSQTNTVSVTGKPPTGPNVSDTAKATVVDNPQPVTVLGEKTPPAAAPGVATPPAAPPAAVAPATPTQALPVTGTQALFMASLAFALLSLGTFVIGMAIPKAAAARRRL